MRTSIYSTAVLTRLANSGPQSQTKNPRDPATNPPKSPTAPRPTLSRSGSSIIAPSSCTLAGCTEGRCGSRTIALIRMEIWSAWLTFMISVLAIPTGKAETTRRSTHAWKPSGTCWSMTFLPSMSWTILWALCLGLCSKAQSAERWLSIC